MGVYGATVWGKDAVRLPSFHLPSGGLEGAVLFESF
jgi:hypothetical protein